MIGRYLQKDIMNNLEIFCHKYCYAMNNVNTVFDFFGLFCTNIYQIKCPKAPKGYEYSRMDTTREIPRYIYTHICYPYYDYKENKWSWRCNLEAILIGYGCPEYIFCYYKNKCTGREDLGLLGTCKEVMICVI